jgi:hypothetical protein
VYSRRDNIPRLVLEWVECFGVFCLLVGILVWEKGLNIVYAVIRFKLAG